MLGVRAGKRDRFLHFSGVGWSGGVGGMGGRSLLFGLLLFWLLLLLWLVCDRRNIFCTE